MADAEISHTFCCLQTPTSVPHLSLSPTQLLPKLWRLQPSASRLPLPGSPLGRCWLAPRLPTKWWILPGESDLTGGGEAAGAATTEPEDEGQMRSAASAPVCVWVFTCRYVNVCVNTCRWMAMSVGGYFGTCSQVFSLFFLFFFSFFAPVTVSIWTQSISLAVRCSILLWKLTKYQQCLTLNAYHVCFWTFTKLTGVTWQMLRASMQKKWWEYRISRDF